MEKEYDHSPQAKFVKEVMRKERPGLSEDELEELWQERLRAVQEDLGEGNCAACGS